MDRSRNLAKTLARPSKTRTCDLQVRNSFQPESVKVYETSIVVCGRGLRAPRDSTDICSWTAL
jgi:hypothetical protein